MKSLITARMMQLHYNYVINSIVSGLVMMPRRYRRWSERYPASRLPL